MLTPTQFEAVGRLALTFNTIEFVIETYTTHFLGTPEWSVALLLTGEQRLFRRKAERFQSILKAICEERSVLHLQIESVQKLIEQAKTLADKRKEYVHGILCQDLKTKQPRLRIKGVEMVCWPRPVDMLTLEAIALADQLQKEIGELYEALQHDRGH
jgi:hypothetical protein